MLFCGAKTCCVKKKDVAGLRILFFVAKCSNFAVWFLDTLYIRENI